MRGWSAVYVPSAVVYHLGGATTDRIAGFQRRLIARNHLAFVLKDFPARWLVRFAPYIAAELARSLLVAARAGQAGAVLSGWASVRLRGRRAVQRSRTVSLEALERGVFGAKRTRRDLLSVRPSAPRWT